MTKSFIKSCPRKLQRIKDKFHFGHCTFCSDLVIKVMFYVCYEKVVSGSQKCIRIYLFVHFTQEKNFFFMGKMVQRNILLMNKSKQKKTFLYEIYTYVSVKVCTKRNLLMLFFSPRNTLFPFLFKRPTRSHDGHGNVIGRSLPSSTKDR